MPKEKENSHYWKLIVKLLKAIYEQQKKPIESKEICKRLDILIRLYAASLLKEKSVIGLVHELNIVGLNETEICFCLNITKESFKSIRWQIKKDEKVWRVNK